MKIPTVYILCGVHNDLEYTKGLLQSIRNSEYRKVKTIIVDDGSTDGSSEYIKTNYPEINIIKGNGNLWWTGAMEKGVEYISSVCGRDDYLLTINNDCMFDNKYISSLVSFMKNNSNSIVGSLVLDKLSGNIVDAGVLINWDKALFEPIKINNDSRLVGCVNVDTLSTKGSMYPVKIFQEIGNFDRDNFPHYLSDYEFSCRARKFGYKLILNYDSVVINDSLRTGKEIINNQPIRMVELKNYLFSKKSKINIFDQFKFFWLYCPDESRLKCMLSLLKKVLYLLSLTPLIYPLREIFIHHKNA